MAVENKWSSRECTAGEKGMRNTTCDKTFSRKRKATISYRSRNEKRARENAKILMKTMLLVLEDSSALHQVELESSIKAAESK